MPDFLKSNVWCCLIGAVQAIENRRHLEVLQKKLGLDKLMKMSRLLDVMTYVHEIAEVEVYDEKRRRGLHRSLSSSFIVSGTGSDGLQC